MAHSTQPLDTSDKNKYTDQELVRLITKRNSRALEILFKRYGARGIRLAQRVGLDNDLAQEIVSEAFCRVWHNADRFQTARGTFAGWFYSIVHNLAVDEIRRSKRRARATADEDLEALMLRADSNEHELMEHVVRQMEITRVHAALAALPESQRRAIQLAFFEGLSRREISRRLNAPLGTVQTRVRLGKDKLRQLLYEAPVIQA